MVNYQELVKDKKQPQDIYQLFVQPDHLKMVIMFFRIFIMSLPWKLTYKQCQWKRKISFLASRTIISGPLALPDGFDC